MVVFTQHALLKLTQRNIKKNFVLRTLQKPDRVYHGQANRMLAFKKFRKLYLKVVHSKSGDNVVVITQHWVDAIDE